MLIPAGFMAKQVARKPAWLAAALVEDIYSVSHCISKAFCDYIPQWKHNGYWLLNDLPTLQQVAFDQLAAAGTVKPNPRTVSKDDDPARCP